MKSKKLKIILFAVLILFVLLASFVYLRFIHYPKPFYKPQKVNSSSAQEYQFKKYKYSFLYSKDYVLRGSAPEPVPPQDDLFYYHLNKEGEPLLNSTISFEKIGNRGNQDLLDFIKINFYSWLNYSHVLRKFESPKSGRVSYMKSYKFTTPYGIQGYELYFTIEETDDNNPSHKSYFDTDPYIVFELQDNLTNSPAVFRIFGADQFEGREAINFFLNTLKPI
jgi:hypothetical protein